MSITPKVRGDTWFFRIGPIKRDGALVSLTGASFWFTIKRLPTDATPLAQVTESTTSSGAVVANLATSVADATFTPAATDVVTGTYWIDAQVVESDGTKSTFGPKRFIVKQDLTLA